MTQEPDQEYFFQAGDYALGLLTGAQKRAFEAALARSPELKGEVARCVLHYLQIGIDPDEMAAPPAFGKLLKRELWAENWMPWRRRLRIWEYALGGVAAAVLAYAVYQSDLSEGGAAQLQTRMSAPQYGFELQALFDPNAQALYVEWSGTAPEGQAFVLWLRSGEEAVWIGSLSQAGLNSFNLSRAQLKSLTPQSVLFVALNALELVDPVETPVAAQAALQEM